MKKRNIFSRQAVNFLWVLLGLGAGLQFIEVIWAASKGYLGFFSMMVVIVTEMVITGSIYVIIYKFLIKPCNETRKLFKHFIQSGSFQELIDQDYQIFPEQNEVMQKLDSILDKKNIIELSTKHAELLALQNQINPHFLYNCLSLINNKALMNDQPEISQMSQLLSVFYRTTLNKGKSETLLQNEIKNVTSYIDIQRLLHDNCFDVLYQIDPNLPEIEVPNLLLQPLVENSIIHGILPNKIKRGQLFLTVTKVADKIYVSIMDNGVGIPPEKLSTLITTDSFGYGLKNVHDRLLLAYGKGSGLSINSIPGQSTMITFMIPMN